MKKLSPLFLPVVLFLAFVIGFAVSGCSSRFENAIDGVLPPSALQVLNDAGVTDIDIYVVANELDAVEASAVFPLSLSTTDFSTATMLLDSCDMTWTLPTPAPAEWWLFNYRVMSANNFFQCNNAYNCRTLTASAHIDTATNHGAITMVCSTVI